MQKTWMIVQFIFYFLPTVGNACTSSELEFLTRQRDAIQKELFNGTTIIMDRYAYSGVAFSSAKGLDLEWCKAPDVGLLRPDVTLFLDIDPREAESRGGYGEERYEKTDFQLQVRERFHALKDESWVIVDAREDANQVHDAIISAIKPALAPDAPLGLLWKR